MRHLTSFAERLHSTFKREGTFFFDVLPKLNDVLQHYNLYINSFPHSYYINYEKGNEIFITRDLRSLGFQMHDRGKAMDYEHAELTLKALAKLHASCCILKNKAKGETLETLFPVIRDDWLEEPASRSQYTDFVNNGIERSKTIIKDIQGYEKAYKWLQNTNKDFAQLYRTLAKESELNMKVICHGDCWTSNIMFRYDDKGHPEEVVLLDLQMCRIGSAATDISFFMFTTTGGEDRIANFENLISVYYDEFQSLMAKADQSMPFTKQELKDEYQNKIMFGAISGLMILPLVQLPGDTLNMELVNDENVEEFTEEINKKYIALIQGVPECRSRFLALFDELIQRGVVP